MLCLRVRSAVAALASLSGYTQTLQTPPKNSSAGRSPRVESRPNTQCLRWPQHTWICRTIPRSGLVFFLTAVNPFKGVLRLGLGLGLWLAGGLAFLFVLFLISSGRGKRVGNLTRPTTHFFFLFPLFPPPGLKGLMSQPQAVSKVAGGLEKLPGPPQVPPQSAVRSPNVLRPELPWVARRQGLRTGRVSHLCPRVA